MHIPEKAFSTLTDEQKRKLKPRKPLRSCLPSRRKAGMSSRWKRSTRYQAEQPDVLSACMKTVRSMNLDLLHGKTVMPLSCLITAP